MKTLRLTVLGALALALTACPPPEEEETTTDEQDVEVAEEETVNLSEIGDSGVSGEASLMALNGQTDVRVDVEAEQEQADAQVQAAVYRQQCEAVEEQDDGRMDAGETGTEDDAAMDQDTMDATGDGMSGTAEQVAQLDAISLDQEGRGAGSTTVQQRMDRLMDGEHSIQLRIDNQVVACGDLSGGLTTGF